MVPQAPSPQLEFERSPFLEFFAKSTEVCCVSTGGLHYYRNTTTDEECVYTITKFCDLNAVELTMQRQSVMSRNKINFLIRGQQRHTAWHRALLNEALGSALGKSMSSDAVFAAIRDRLRVFSRQCVLFASERPLQYLVRGGGGAPIAVCGTPDAILQLKPSAAGKTRLVILKFKSEKWPTRAEIDEAAIFAAAAYRAAADTAAGARRFDQLGLLPDTSIARCVLQVHLYALMVLAECFVWLRSRVCVPRACSLPPNVGRRVSAAAFAQYD
jgi:hypothetical protein